MHHSSVAIVSQNFGLLAQCLAAALQEHSGTLKKQWIFVPNGAFKQWLLVQLANFSPSGCVAGVKICTIDEWLYSQFPEMPTKLEMRCLIYQKLSSEQNQLELTLQLTDLLFSYGKYGIPEVDDWQIALFHSLFSSDFQLPVQFLQGKPFFTSDPCHFFGFNTLPTIFWSYLNQSGGYFYLFSPCIHFWEDVRSEKEAFRNTEFSNAPRILANLGKLGREKGLDVETEVAYAPTHTKTMLGALQNEIVNFEKFEGEKKTDHSIQVFLTGASRFCEVEILCKEILNLANEKGLLFSEIVVLAPDIQQYIPIIECLFSKALIPYRFSQKGVQNSFYRGIIHLIDLMKGPWNEKKIKKLVNEPSFLKKMRLAEKEVIHWNRWIEEIFQYSSDWEKGFAELLKKATTLEAGPVREMIPITSFETLEKLLEMFQSLQADLCYKNQSLEKWAAQMEALAEKYLLQEEEGAAFDRAIRNLKKARIDSSECPFDLIEDLFTQSLYSSCNGNSLHAVSCGSIVEGAVIPARACFLLGMDEESFPRKRVATSLDLLKKAPDIADIDRYLFLQILLNTKEYLMISYGHISPHDGKPVGPSIIVQELLDVWPIPIKKIAPQSFPQQKVTKFSFTCPEEKPSKEGQLSLYELTFFARNPWKYYLQKVENIVLENRKERSFHAHKSIVSRSSLEWPLPQVLSARKGRYPGIFQEAFSIACQERAAQMQKQLDDWGKKRTSLTFYQTANGSELPPIQVSSLEIVGEIPHCMEDGALHFGGDQLSSLLKVWPEVLAVCIALQTPKIYFLKTGKIKTISNAQEALEKFVSYFLRCQNTLSPLIPDWAESILRDKEFSPEFDFDDEVNQWIYSRLEIPNHFLEEWKWLKNIFSELIEIT